MKIEVNGKTFEYTVNGKNLEEDEVFEAFVALGSSFFPFAVITRSDNAEVGVRAVSFAADEDYANKLIDTMEPTLSDEEEIGLISMESDNQVDLS